MSSLSGGVGHSLDFKEAVRIGAALHGQYISENPFPNIVVNDFLGNELAQAIHSNWPSPLNSRDFNGHIFYDRKRLISPYDCHESILNAFYLFNSAPFITLLENMTGIKGLISDPYFWGGGLHEIGSGGFLGIHADYQIHKRLNIQRRVNLIIYMNEGWDLEWGGNLELYNQKDSIPSASIAPLYNRAVIFNTNSTSFHGHPQPLTCPEGIQRKSLALYYFTASDSIYSEIEDRSTVFKVVGLSNSIKDDALKAERASKKYVSLARQILPPFIFRYFRDRLHDSQL